MNKRAKRICKHDTRNHTDVVYRCPCGNVWVNGTLLGRVEKELGAAAMFAALRPVK